MLTFVARLPSIIFTQSKKKTLLPDDPLYDPLLRDAPFQSTAAEKIAKEKTAEILRRTLETEKLEDKIWDKERERDRHVYLRDRATSKLKGLKSEKRGVETQLKSSIKAKDLLNEEIARSRWGSTSNLERLYEQLRALNRQIESLSAGLGVLRTHIRILTNVERREAEAIKELNGEIERTKRRIKLLDPPDPFYDPIEEKIFDPPKDNEEEVFDPFKDIMIP